MKGEIKPGARITYLRWSGETNSGTVESLDRTKRLGGWGAWVRTPEGRETYVLIRDVVSVGMEVK